MNRTDTITRNVDSCGPICSGAQAHESRHLAIAPAHKPGRSRTVFTLALLASTIVVLLLCGCGSGGYPGAGIASISASTVTLDATQSIAITTSGSENLPVTWTLSGSTCTGAGCGSVSPATGTQTTYTAPASVSAPFQVTLRATIAGTSSGRVVTITVNPAPAIVGTPPSGVVGTPYSFTFTSTPGTAPLKLSLSSGSVPAGLSFNATTGTVSGTPTTPGTSTFTLQLVDSSDVPSTVTASKSITINAAGAATSVTVSGNPPAGAVGTAYTAALNASGGTAPYTWSVLSGALPSGLTLNASTGVISGTPTAVGTATFTAQAKDANGVAGNTSFTITVGSGSSAAPVTIATGALPSGTVGVPYTATVGVTGGTAPYTCTVAGGTVPAGLALNANCSVTGTPTTAGTSSFTVQATDAANPAHSGSGPQTITINAAPTLALGNPPAATAGAPYTGTIPVSGGTAPYACTVTAGTLPAGLSLGANCTITGTPTGSGSTTVTVQATDSGSPAITGTGAVTVTVNPAALTLATGTLPNGTVGVAYSATVGVAGGTAPYTCQLVNGTLPAGLALNANCAVAGTPTVAGTSTVTVKATDTGNPAQTVTGPQTITIAAAASTITPGNPPAATVNTPYTGTIPVSGGTAPYTCALSSGTLPAGLSLATNCTVSGTPTSAGTTTVTVSATDNGSPTQTGSGPVTITVNGQTGTLTIGNPPTATVSTPYTGTIPVTGGTAPYSCTITGGTLPAGLALGANCQLSGTPTTSGTATVSVSASDSGSPAVTGTGSATITVQPIPTLILTGSLPNAVVNQSYSQTLQASGGVAPYTYAVTNGALPAGITLSSTGVVSGTPTTPGASAFTVTATDSEGTPQTASLPLTLLVTYAPNANSGLLQGPYAYLFQGYDDVAVGVLAYQTATAGSITADGNGAITAGEQDTNNQAFVTTATTVPTRNVLGTYTIGNDRRGSLTLTSFNSDGSVFRTRTYSIALRAPVSPATSSAQGSLAETDDANLVGTRGSGTLLQQSATAIAAGLSGSYAFGMQGDTPCLPTCTIGIVAGPVASVGQFTATAGAITGGTTDANIGATNYPSVALTGAYSGADGNGRVALTLSGAGLPAGVFPTDYAAYVIDGSRVMLVSLDRHAAYILQAGTATLQTQTAFSNASLSGPYVGYENAPVNPGLLNVALEQVLNLQTSTIFRGTGNGAGSCTTTNVDSAGLTGILNSLGSAVNAQVVSLLLGSYQLRGDAACTAAVNGRAVLSYPPPDTALAALLLSLGLSTNPPSPRVAYLTGTNQGYFLETSYAGLGMLEAQTGSPYSNGSLNGTYVYGSIPAGTLASVDSAGTFTADGAGNDTSTVDRNVGVGNVNVIQLGITTPGTYNVTDPAVGRFSLSTNEVVYEIMPGRFVVLEPALLNLNPYVALLF